MPPDPELTLLIPCLNEARTLPGVLAEARAALAALGVAGEIVVADNGSTDGSVALAAAAGARVVAVATRGYGHALGAGLAQARGRCVIMADADGSYDFREAGRLLDRIREGCEVVIGNRFSGGIQPGAMPWKNRYLGNPLLSALGRRLFGLSVRDFHCGLRGGTREALLRLELHTGGMEFASEMPIKAALLGLRIGEVPVTLRRDGRDRPPHLRPWRDGWRHLRFMLLFSPRWLFLYPGLALLAIGAAGFVALLGGPVSFGSVRLDVHTLLYAAASVLCGFQACAFAVISQAFVVEAGLAPVSAATRARLERINVESCLVAAALLALVGLGLSLNAVRLWGSERFGDLVPAHMLRWVVPAVTCLVLATQVALGGFFLGLIRLRLRR
ncbi:MAG: glycosyltransferase family 2 protein [Verrucomicrobia bacterium]|nr:glycosyltransferase family 2 protein [Verrucomicrobiota bacterium]